MNPQQQLSRAGYILTGGKSSRMGADKAFLDFGGSTLLGRAIGVVRETSPNFAIVGDPAKFAAYGAVIADLYPGCGALAGIHAGLLHSSAELNLMLAVDMPFVTRELLSFLFAAASEADAIVVVPRTARGFQPLCAVYRRAFAPAAEGRALQDRCGLPRCCCPSHRRRRVGAGGIHGTAIFQRQYARRPPYG